MEDVLTETCPDIPRGGDIMPTKQAIRQPGADRYFELVTALPLKPIRTDDHLDRAVEMIDSLIDRDQLDQDEQDYLDVLTDLVERYESEAHPLPPVSGAEMLRHLIDARDVTQLAVAESTGIAESTISSILSGKRELSTKHIKRLAAYFDVNPAHFLS